MTLRKSTQHFERYQRSVTRYWGENAGIRAREVLREYTSSMICESHFPSAKGDEKSDHKIFQVLRDGYPGYEGDPRGSFPGEVQRAVRITHAGDHVLRSNMSRLLYVLSCMRMTGRRSRNLTIDRGSVKLVVLYVSVAEEKRVLPERFRMQVETQTDLIEAEHDTTEVVKAMHDWSKEEAICEDSWPSSRKGSGKTTHTENARKLDEYSTRESPRVDPRRKRARERL